MQQPPYPTQGNYPPPQGQPAYPPYQNQGQGDNQNQGQPDYLPYLNPFSHPHGQFGYPAYPGLTQTPEKNSLKYGLIFGGALIVSYFMEIGADRLIFPIMMGADLSYSTILLYSYIPVVIFAFINWAIYFVAGLVTARNTPQQPTRVANMACLLASLCSFVAYILIFTATTLPYLLSTPSYWQTASSSIIIGFVITLAELAIGIGLGALGAQVGKQKAGM
jgi:hypothetical protein